MKAAAHLTIPNVSERRHVHIINPNAGSSRFYESAVSAIKKSGDEMLESNSGEHLKSLVTKLFREDPFAHAVIYGGDGSVYETVNGIMESGNAMTASFSVFPAGSGNDFSAYANDSAGYKKGELNKIDLISVKYGDNTSYFANMMNIGFDCSVVFETYTLKKKPFLKGSAAYIAGVVKTLAVKKTTPITITLSGGDLKEPISMQKDILLTACANGQFCGGGFKSAPLARIDDGIMDVLVVNDISRTKFISMVSNYKRGDYINESGEMLPKFNGVLDYYRCRKMTVSGMKAICLDGEVKSVSEKDTVEVEIIKDALFFAAI